jgi:ribosomal protein L16 Arg81 hydroxylase
VLQLCGTKHWTVGTKIVRGLAHSSLFAIDNASVTQLARERDQFRNIDLEEGGLLYVPRGLAHRATAQDTYSIHLSVGVFRATGLDFAEFVLKYLIGDIAVRDYFAHPGRSGITPAHTEFMDSIAEKLAVLARDEQLRSRFLELRQREAGLGEPKDT